VAKILVVEDNEQLAAMLVERLERRGHSVLLAAKAEAAFASAKASEPDVIILEQQLRGQEDWAIAKALKFDDHTRAIPIIALMGANSEEARDAAMQSGCDALHAKPIDFGRLVQQIEAETLDAQSGEA
jgi:DNA-binding response OmpR family regulator